MTKIRALIVGAGVGGLVAGLGLARTGCRVMILEQATELSEVGAGIQLAPNATRILEHLDILSEVFAHASRPTGTIVRRYSDDSEIGPRSHIDQLQARFSTPMLVIHRADLQRILVKAARSSGVEIVLGSRVKSVDPDFAAAVTLESGQKIVGDIIIAADGINSQIRARMVDYWGIEDKITSTGDSAYRVIIPRLRLTGCSQIIESLDRGLSTRWIGPHGHIMAYPIRNKTLYNIVMVHANKSSSTDESNLWSRRGSIHELRAFYKNWSPAIQHLTAQIDSSCLMQWPLNKRTNLPSWYLNRVCLLGDAAHPMLPYVAQGAAQAMEDAITLAICLSSSHDTNLALTAYMHLRKRRAEFVQGSAAAMRNVLHFEDGIEQEQRDATMRAPRVEGYKHPDLWADPGFQEQVWGYDVVEAAERVCRSLKESLGKEPSGTIML